MEGKMDTPPSVYDGMSRVEVSDPSGELVDRSLLTDAELREIGALMTALRHLREAEEQVSEASLKYMQLGRMDMRALHFLIVAQNLDSLVTAGALATHLGISTASTTKLLDRLERSGHLVRQPHPSDRRSLVISITPETHTAAKLTVGRQQAKRVNAAARLTSEEREIVRLFLEDMAQELSLDGVSWADPNVTG